MLCQKRRGKEEKDVAMMSANDIGSWNKEKEERYVSIVYTYLQTRIASNKQATTTAITQSMMCLVPLST